MVLLSTPSTIIAHRFLIEEMAGSGGMGSVYRARDLLNGQTIAVKILHGAAPTPQDAERFAREARLLATLEHPGIVRYVAHGQTPDGLPFIAMEWLEGYDLERRLAERPLTVEESLLLLRQIAEALSVSHRRGIVHRDIKPSNLFLRDGDIARVTLLDFGIARDGSPSSGAAARVLTRTGALVGTPSYMAPEQARGRTQLTPSADIFSLGCLLYECLTGRPPFIGEHLQAILVKILFEPEVPLRTLRPELPEPLERLLSQMLNKDPTARLPHAMALLEAMSALETPSSSSNQGSSYGSASTEALTMSEQQLVSVLIARADEEQAMKSTLNPGEAAEEEKRLATVCETLNGMGVRTEVLTDGTLVAALVAGRSEGATDQVERAARCALLVHRRSPESVVALATGRGVLEGQLPVGEAVNRAVRLAHGHPPPRQGEPGAVILDRVTAGLLPARFRIAHIDDEMASLLEEQPGDDEMRPLTGREAPCVGRESELGQLEALLGACIEEAAPRALLVLGPEGSGKSRLRREFLRRVAGRGEELVVLTGRGDLLTAGTPFAPLREALLALCGVEPSDPDEVRGDKLWQRLGLNVPERERERIVVFLGELCGVPFVDDNNPALAEARREPQKLEDCIRQAFLDWLGCECAVQPIILALEELHWWDVSTVWMVDAALRELYDRPLFVLALARPEVTESFPRLWHDCVQLMPLRPLSRKASELLVRHVLGSQTPAETTTRIVEQAAGNPLYIEELCRAAADGRDEELPQTVLAMLQARIGRLEAGARRTLRAASVFGESSWSGGVAALLATARSECERWLVYLVREELFEQCLESRFLDETEYRFRHGPMREAAYSLLIEPDRVLGHRLAAKFLAAQKEAPAVLAAHYREGGEVDKALRCLMQAGEESLRLGLLAEGRQHYAAARWLFAHLLETPEYQRLRVEVLLRQIEAGLTSESTEVQLGRLAEARALLGVFASPDEPSLEDIRAMTRIDYASGLVFHHAGRPHEALPYFRHVQNVAEQSTDTETALAAALAIGAGLCAQGRFGASRDRLEWVLGTLEQLGEPVEWLTGHGYRMLALAASGRRSPALAHAQRGPESIGLADHPLSQARFRMLRALMHLACGDWPTALAESRELLDLAQKLEDKLFLYTAWDVSACAESHLGQHEQAFLHRGQARELRHAVEGGLLGDWFSAAEAEMLLYAGRHAEALEQARLVVAAGRPVGLLYSQAVGERVWGCALAQLGGDRQDIEAHFRTALLLCQDGEQAINAALTEVCWGRILQQRGDEPAARAHLATGLKALTQAGCEAAARQAQESLG